MLLFALLLVLLRLRLRLRLKCSFLLLTLLPLALLPLALLLLLLLLLDCLCLQAQQLSTVDQQQLEADQAAAVEQEDFETAATLDEQLQVGGSSLCLFGLVLPNLFGSHCSLVTHTEFGSQLLCVAVAGPRLLHRVSLPERRGAAAAVAPLWRLVAEQQQLAVKPEQQLIPPCFSSSFCELIHRVILNCRRRLWRSSSSWRQSPPGLSSSRCHMIGSTLSILTFLFPHYTVVQSQALAAKQQQLAAESSLLEQQLVAIVLFSTYFQIVLLCLCWPWR
jgi:hypothetical protein